MTQIAIVGMSCLFPGARTPQQFWDVLTQGQQTTTDATIAEIGVAPAHFYSADKNRADTSYFLHGGYVQDVATEPALQSLDRAIRWAVSVARGALAGSNYQPGRTGVILGNLSFPTRHSNMLLTTIYSDVLGKALGDRLEKPGFGLPSEYTTFDVSYGGGDTLHIQHDARSPGYPAAMIAAMLGLGGPQFALDAACASSLYALDLASRYLRAGKADLMLAGAVSAADPLFVNLGFAHLGGYPASGQRSRPLDETSGGLIAGEGAGMFALKRYADALRDGDTIYALLRGSGISNDGRGKHVLTPNSKGQVLALERAHAAAGLRPGDLDYIECHASGTTVGDRTELQSMGLFFAEGHAPRIGSVKSNVGHLLTTAGMASMIKLILSMAHGQLPATINNQQPLTSPDSVFDGSQVVTEHIPWPQTNGQPRRGGVNAFGFGGVSAHLILEAYENQPVTQSTQSTQSNQPTQLHKLAIIGMDAHFGPLDGLKAFSRAIYEAEAAFGPLPEGRWKGLQHHPDVLAAFGLPDGKAPDGAYIGSFPLDFMAYGIPPNPADEPIPQQLLLLKVADAALRDADLAKGSNVAVLVAMGTELALHQVRARADLNWQVGQALNAHGIHLDAEQTAVLEHISKDALLSSAEVNHYTSYIGNIAASRVSQLWDFNGPAFTVSAEENSTFKALEVAQLLLSSGDVDAVVVGAVDLAGGLESVLTRNSIAPIHHGSPKAGIDADATGWQVGEGAGAVVLQRAAAADRAKIYATIDAIAFAQEDTQVGAFPSAPTAGTIQRAAQSALTEAGISPADVGYLELHASGIDHEDEAEISALTTIYQGEAATTAVGTAKANVGHTYAAAGMAALIRAALAVSGRFIPAIPNWNAPKLAATWADTRLWVAHKSRAWVEASPIAAISGLGADGTAAHVVLSRPAEAGRLDESPLRSGSPVLLPVAANDIRTLLDRLSDLREAVGRAADLDEVAADAFRRYDASLAYAVAIVGKSLDQLHEQIEAALDGLPAAIDNGGTWETPTGSVFSSAPVGRDGHVAFVYPGAFNSYPKLGYDLFRLFPQSYDNLHEVRDEVSDVLNERLLYPQTIAKPSLQETRAMKGKLAMNPAAMVKSGLSFALVYSRIMQDTFGVTPGSAFGYSLGEGSMMWGMGVWRDADTSSANLNASPLFTERLAGPMNAIRAAWGIPAGTPTDDFWAAHFIAADVDAVRAAVAQENRVYLTHINTPTEVMIAGDPAACERVVAALGTESMKAPFTVAIHTPAMMSEFGEFRYLHDLPVTPVDGVTFYSAADYEPLTLERGVIATSIGRMACNPVDFPRLIERAYADGARVFIELGPRSTCSRWISETLVEHPHVAVSIDKMSADDRTSIIRMLAQLVTHRVPMDLSALYPLDEPALSERSVVRQVRLGGDDIYAAVMNADIGDVDLSAAQSVSAAARSTVGSTTAQQTAMPAEVTRVHTEFLQSRGVALQQMAEVITMQMQGKGGAVTPPSAPTLPPPPEPNPGIAPSVAQGVTPMYNNKNIVDFSLYRVADCYGELYAIYDDRRAPRIPNTDLLLISRAIDITGERFVSKPGTMIHAEYDVPLDAWWYRDNPYPIMPYLVYMEIALQPSGFLSAHHGPTLDFPEIDFYFRNLDGYGVLHDDVDMRGRTITNYVTMLGSTTMNGIIIQKFDFKMYDGDLLFYEGEATFGYFTLQALDSQAGLDAGKQVPRWIDTVELAPDQVKRVDPNQPYGEGYLSLPHPQGMLAFTDEIKIVPEGGTYGKGYAYGNTIIDPSAWFFKAHFHEDPVMPGSIGVETIMQAMQAYVIETGLADDFTAPYFAQTDGAHRITWRYRGQILSTSEKSHIEANIKEIVREPGQITVIADASLWRDKLRIYAVTDIALTIKEG